MKRILPFTKEVSEEFTQIMVEQDDKGIEKYNKPLDPMDVKYDWLNMMVEELADAVKYAKAEQKRRDVILNDVINDINQMMDSIESDAVYYSLNGIKLKLLLLAKTNKKN